MNTGWGCVSTPTTPNEGITPHLYRRLLTADAVGRSEFSRPTHAVIHYVVATPSRRPVSLARDKDSPLESHHPYGFDIL
jgi:hypothetical protein